MKKNFKLRSWNEETVIEVLNQLKSNDRTCVLNTTGTGKAYVSLAVSDLFNKILYLAPSYDILDYFGKLVEQYLPDKRDQIILATYQSLINRKYISLHQGYDLIILDEFHHLGAPVWGARVNEVIKNNEEVKLLGLSASPVRNLDGGRDMSKEIFNGNISSRITLTDAVDKGILKAPNYIIGSVNAESEVLAMIDKIIKSNLSSTDKSNALAKLEHAKVDYINGNNLNNIFKKHIRKDLKRLIVFNQYCSSFTELSDKLRTLLEGVGYKNIRFYQADSSTCGHKNIERFNSDDFSGLKVIITVDMLNEGVHIKGIDTCIMFRKTESMSIFMQQLGRIMSASNKRVPTVIDLVGNAEILPVWREGCYTSRDNSTNPRNNVINKGGINITYTDYRLSFLELKNIINEYFLRTIPTEEGLRDFILEKQRIPNHRIKGEGSYYNFMRKGIKNHSFMNSTINIINSYLRYKRYTEKDLVNFIEEHKRFPRYISKSGELGLYEFMIRGYKNGLFKKSTIDLIDKYRSYL